ncbi:putative receptor-like protein kinase At3g47110 [Pyrus x bretschneideri]|uniref:putative receptor-like protein kinase At3g47110 n=1 Tax=Pyrus x bretschneideri TaxID=225117 RepID=UPI00202FF488|nr:putative receptor-like protein kinase At3g47110 [Pyrus x bretschneideri]
MAEYGMGGQVSTLGDVYSFGILLLEMFAGKRPTDDMFKDGLSIHQFAAMAMPDNAGEILDAALLFEREEADDNDDRCRNDVHEKPIIKYVDRSSVQGRSLEECLVIVVRIGLSCSAISPGDRMLMDVVVNKMKAIRDSYLKIQ